MNSLEKKLIILGASRKKYFSRSGLFPRLLGDRELLTKNNDLFCIENNDWKLKQAVYFCDNLDSLLYFINKVGRNIQMSLEIEEYEYLKDKVDFSNIEKFQCYRLKENVHGANYSGLLRVEEFLPEHFELIKNFSSLHQTEFGMRQLFSLTKENGYGLVGKDGSFIYIEDHPFLDSRFGSTLYSMGSGIEVIKLLSQTVKDFRSTDLSNYYTFLDVQNLRTIKLHEKFGFEIEDKLSRTTIYEVIT